MHRSQINVWTAEKAEEPTWRDGLRGSDRTYLIVAVPHETRKGYQAVVFGRYGGNRGKIKFYPNPESLGLDRRQLVAIGLDSCLDRPNEPYTRYCCSLEQLKEVLKLLPAEQWAVAPLDGLHLALTEQRGRESSRQRAPVDSEFEPKPAAESTDTGGIAVVS